MSGIYIHIPFCKSKCYYCDFYSDVSLEYKNDFIESLIKEIKLRKSYLPEDTIDTVYFGGGTPTLLSSNDINNIFDKICKFFKISESAEITIEANPDDLTLKYLQELIKTTPVNRLSIGIQSFFDDDLQLMGRRHNAVEAIKAIKSAQDIGFSNISGDLIYGLPDMSSEKWVNNLFTFFDLQIQHLSAYHLTYEHNTKFWKLKEAKSIKPIIEEKSKELFSLLCDKTKKNEFIHYEISNFAKQGYFSKHNSSYWENKPYLGLGPSSHSYDGNSRQWNVSNIKQYINGVGEGSDFYEKELLSETDKFNEYIITSLRTMWGINSNYIKDEYGANLHNFMLNRIQKYIESNHVILKDNNFVLSREGMFISDLIFENLFY